ncbi:M15 family metallopeptidase [Gordonia sp. HS-NH1]|uniref:M15 family metallopeptidase n=1 Tax=Gordonia sp. HS-NH1 TaxID=1435068 RepID=UPI000A07B1BA|nr:M15 family metallopeptidase [Gordonia sp. HS-NH1]
MVSPFLVPPDPRALSSAAISVPPINFRGWPSDPGGIEIGFSTEELTEPPATVATMPYYRMLAVGHPPALTLLRTGVCGRLSVASAALPGAFGLVILDGWRTRKFQRELVNYYSTDHDPVGAGFVSSADDPDFAPPHVTGGAVDLTISYNGIPLALGTDFDEFTPAAATDWYETHAVKGADAVLIRDLRRMFGNAMLKAGFAPYQQEWWHWSYGDQIWARFYGLQHSIYPAIDGP